MQIAIVTSEFGENAGGLSFGCYSYANMLSRIGYDLTIISSIYNNLNDNICEFEFPVISSKLIICEGGYKKELKEHLFFRAQIKNVISEIKENKFDYIISFGAGLNGLFASELAHILKIKLIVLIRGSEINLSISDVKLREINYQCFKKANKVIALSAELLMHSKEICFNSNIFYDVIPNPIEPYNLISIPDTNKGTIILGCGSKNLNEKKGVANLISMMSFLNQNKKNNFRFEFAGRVDSDLLNNYLELCMNFNVQHIVQFIGDLTRDEFIERMKSWDFYVQGSFCEGFSNSLGDYLALGKTFLLSDSGFISESIKKKTKELVFEDFIPENMANKMISLINNENIFEIYQSAYNEITQLTSYNILCEKWKTIFEVQTISDFSITLQRNNILSIVLHDINQEGYSNIDTTEQSFHSFVKRVSAKGYQLCSANKYFLSSNKSNLIICTFDDAYSGVIDYAFPILKEFGFTATVFVCYDYIGKNNDWNFKDTKNRKHLELLDLFTLQKEGWEIGSHGLTHRSLLRLSDKDLYIELNKSKESLENLFGEINTYAYPYGDFNEFCISQTSEIYKIAFALTKGGTLEGIDNYQIRRYFITEILNLLDK